MSREPKFTEATFPGYEQAFKQLENPIGRILLLAKTQTVLHDVIFDGIEDVKVTGLQNEALGFIGDEIRRAADDLNTLFLDLWNAAPDDVSPPASERLPRVPVKGVAR